MWTSPVQARVLRVAQRQRGDGAAPEADDGDSRVLDLDVGVVEVVPLAVDLGRRAHQPQQQVELVRRLVDEDAAALGRPATAPRVRPVVGLVAPAQDDDVGHHRLADLARVDRPAHADDRPVPAPLAHDPDRDAGRTGRRHGPVAAPRSAANGFSTSAWAPAPRRGHDRGLVLRVGRADRDHVQPLDAHHLLGVGVPGDAEPCAEVAGPRRVGVAHRAELRPAERRERERVGQPDLAAADEPGPKLTGHRTPPRRCAVGVRRSPRLWRPRARRRQPPGSRR